MKHKYLLSTFSFPVIAFSFAGTLYVFSLLMKNGLMTLPAVWITAVSIAAGAVTMRTVYLQPSPAYFGNVLLLLAFAILFLFFSLQRTAAYEWFGLPVLPHEPLTENKKPGETEEPVIIETAEGIISSAAVTRSPYETATSLTLLGISGSGEMRMVEASSAGTIPVRMRKELFRRSALHPGSIVRCSLRRYGGYPDSPWYVQDITEIRENQLMDVSRMQLEQISGGFLTHISSSLERIRNKGRIYLLNKVDQRSWESQLFITALVLGEPVSAYDPIFENCRKSGCSYIIALSGMHVAIFLAILSSVLKKIFDKRIQSLLIVCFLVLYVWFVGLKPSLVRAAGMVCLSTCFRAIGRPSDSLTVLFTCLAVQVLLFPQSAGTVSFVLSYTALSGILMFSGSCRDMLPWRIPLRIRQLLGTSLAASLSTWAYIGTVFGEISFIGIAAGIPSIAIITMIVWSSIIYIAVPSGLPEFCIGQILDVLSNAARIFWKLCARVPVYEMNTPEKRSMIYIIMFLLCMMWIVLQVKAVIQRKRYDAEYRLALQLQLTEIDPGVPEYKKSLADEKIRAEFYD